MHRDDMTRQEAEDFVTESLALAMSRDASSGGVIRTVTIDEKDGVKQRYLAGNQIPVFHEELEHPGTAAAAAMVVG
jgi:20S proteasome subunit beta 1